MSNVNLPDINQVIISGRAVNDATHNEVNDTDLVKFRVAYNPRTGKNSKEQPSVFYDVQVWNKLAGFLKNKIRKGSPLIIHGKIISEEWNDKETGERRTKHSIRANQIDILNRDDLSTESSDNEDHTPFD